MRRWARGALIGSAAIALLAVAAAGGYAAGFLGLRQQIMTMNADIGRIMPERGIDEARYVRLGGARQWVTMRGQDRDAPVLLYLHGGPGGALADVAYSFQRPWEDYFVVVQWDQRGYGRSSIDGAALQGTMTLERHIADTIELAEQLNRRFGRKIVLVGQSWGGVLGAEAARRRPDLLHAFVGIGPMTAWEENFDETRRLLLERARRTGDKTLEEKMIAVGPQPSAKVDIKAHNRWVADVQREMTRYGYSWHNYSGGTSWFSRFLAGYMVSPSVTTRDLADQMLGRGGLPFDPDPELIGSVSGWRVEKNVGSDYQVPVIMIVGRHDWQTPITLARRYFKTICAPYKSFVELPFSAHVVIAEEPGRLLHSLVEQALPATRGEVPAGAEACAPRPAATNPRPS